VPQLPQAKSPYFMRVSRAPPKNRAWAQKLLDQKLLDRKLLGQMLPQKRARASKLLRQRALAGEPIGLATRMKPKISDARYSAPGKYYSAPGEGKNRSVAIVHVCRHLRIYVIKKNQKKFFVPHAHKGHVATDMAI
jgi:hypothetical protein